MKFLMALDFMIYWAIIIMPFSVAIAPALANAFIGIFSVSYILKKIIKREIPQINKWVLISFFSLVFVSLVSFVNTVSYNSSFHGITKLLKYLLILFVCSEEIKDRKHISKIFISICCGVFLISVDALWQFFFGYDFIHKIALHYNIGLPRASASFPNPNILGVYLTALTPLVVGLAMLYFEGRQKLVALIVGALGLIGIYLTFSRGAGLAIFLAVFFLCIMGRKKWLIIGLISLILIFPFVVPENIKKWAKEINYNPIVFMLNEDRISIYSNTVNMIKHHPFVGVGINTFSKNYGKYKTESAEKYAHTPDTIYAHNIYLQTAGEVGLLGLFAMLWFLFIVFKQASATFSRLSDKYLKAVGISLVACIIAFLINGLTETSLYYSRVAMTFWYLIGVSLALNKFVNAEKR